MGISFKHSPSICWADPEIWKPPQDYGASAVQRLCTKVGREQPDVLIDLLPKDTHLVVYIHALLCDYIYIFIQYIYVHTLLEDIRTEIHFWRENF